MNIVFFGSDDFAAVSLQALLSSGHRVIACVTQPDVRQGRGMKMTTSPIKQMAMEANLPYIQPLTLKDAATVELLKKFNADIFVVVAYGRLLTQEILNIPKVFCINVHGSLLPQCRGAAPINWAILNGHAETGVTVQKMALALDAGDIILQEKMTIGPEETSTQLRARMAEIGAVVLVRALDAIDAGKYQLTPQDVAKITHASKLSKEMGKINWSKSARDIYNQIRGLQPWPGAFCQYKGKALKVTQAELTDIDAKGFKGGQVITVNKRGIFIATADFQLILTEVQPEAGKVMSAGSFVAGHQLKAGDLLG